MKTNSKIPNTMTHKALEYLARIASQTKKNSSIVEAGSLYGSTAWVFSQNSDESCKVYAIDPWAHEKFRFLERFKQRNHRAPNLSIHAFKAYTDDCDNITAIQGFAPDVVKDMEFKNLELFFEDASHDYETLKKNVNYFYPLLEPGGIICGDDYQSSFPGVIEFVDEFCASIGVKPEVCGQVWAVRKPLDDKKPLSVYSKIGNFYQAEIGVKISTDDGKNYQSSPHCFTDNLFHPKRINSISIFSYNDSVNDIEIEWGIMLSDGSMLENLKLNQTIEINNNQTIVGIKAELIGKNKRLYHNLGYQIATYKNNSPQTELGPSKEVYNGKWLTAENNKSIYSISMSLSSKELRQARNNHSKYVKAGEMVLEFLQPS